MNQETFHLCSRHRRWQNYEQILKHQQSEINTLKEKLLQLGANPSEKRKLNVGPINTNLQKLEKENKELRQYLNQFEELKSFSLTQINLLEQKMMGMFEQNKEKNKETIIELFNYLNNRQEIVNQLSRDISDTKNIFQQFNHLLRKGPIQFSETHESINLIKGTLQSFFTKLNEDIFAKKLPQFREIFKLHKKQLYNEIKDQYTVIEKNIYQKELESLKKQRELFSLVPDNIKEIKDCCRQRQENYKLQIDLLEKQIKQTEIIHTSVIEKYEEVVQQLSQKYKNALQVYARDMVHPTNELRNIIQNEVNYIHQAFDKMIKNYDLHGIVTSLNDTINRYTEYKKRNQDGGLSKLNERIGLSFAQVSEKSRETIYQIRQKLEKQDIDFGSRYREIDTRIKEIEELVLNQKKKGVQLELQNRINCQKEYIVLLEQYNAKLQSCIKRIGAQNPIEEEWKSIIKQIDQKHEYFSQKSEALQASNQKLIQELISVKQFLSSNLKKNEDIFNLFNSLQTYSQQIQRLKLQTFNYFEKDINFQKQIEFQTFAFNEAFFNPSSKLMKVSQKIPVFNIPNIVKQAQIGVLLKETYQQQLEKYQSIRKDHQSIFRSKKVIQIRLQKLLSQVLKVHSQYLKATVDKKQEVQVKFDDKMIKNMSNCLTLKLEDSLSGIKILRESLIKVVGDIKKEFELSSKQMKTLMIYLRGSKLQKSVSDLNKTLGLNVQKINHFNSLIYSLLDKDERKLHHPSSIK